MRKNGILIKCNNNFKIFFFLEEFIISEFFNYLVKNYLIDVGDRFITNESRNVRDFF